MLREIEPLDRLAGKADGGSRLCVICLTKTALSSRPIRGR